MPISNEKFDVVITGAGPSGLWLANQVKIHNPHLNVVVLEKRGTYTREHSVNLKRSSFNGIPDHPGLKEIVDKFKQKKFVKINLIEQELKTLAAKLDIDVRIQEVVKPMLLSQQFPNAKFFIGADGAHSIVRKEIFKDNLKFKQNLQYLVEVKYDVLGSSETFNSKELGSAQLNSRTLVTESVSKKNAEKSTVSFRFFVNEDVYQKMKHARFNNPFKLDTHKHLIPAQVLSTIDGWIDKRKNKFGERRVENSERITAIPLEIYATKTFLKEGVKPGTTWGLIGDAAMGFPFFRSMNTSFLSGTLLARAIANSFSPSQPLLQRLFLPILKWIAGRSIEGNIPDSLVSSAAYFQALSTLEGLAAKVKSLGIKVLQLFIKGSSDASSALSYYREKFNLKSRFSKYWTTPNLLQVHTESLLRALRDKNWNRVNELLDQLSAIDVRYVNTLYELLWNEQPIKPQVWRWGEFAFSSHPGYNASLESKIIAVMKFQEILNRELKSL